MIALELFSGAGGFRLGFDEVGIRTIVQVENDPACLRVLEHHWPDTARPGDIVGFHPEGEFDIVYGSPPCTDISSATGTDIHFGRGGLRHAGTKKAGYDGDQSRLWWEYARVIDECLPRVAVLENVDGLRTNRGGADLRATVETFQRLGYVGAGIMLDASAFGLPLRRPRVFLVAARADGTTGGVALRERLVRAFRWNDPGRVILERPGQPRAEDNGAPRPTPGTYRKLTPEECEQALGWPVGHTTVAGSATARYRMIGNGVAAPAAAWIAHRVREVLT